MFTTNTFILLCSFGQSSNDLVVMFQVNNLLVEKERFDLVLSQVEKQNMQDLIQILVAFKKESVKCEADKTPTIQFVYMGFRELQGLCQPRNGDTPMIARLRRSLLKELESKYTPHMRHLLGVFFWPMFRSLRMFDDEPQTRAEVQYNTVYF